MPFYFRPDDVPELQGLSKWDQRVLLRGTFLKERAMSTLAVLVIIVCSVQFGLNPLIDQNFPHIGRQSLAYLAILIGWFLLVIWGRDLVMMNLLRPKIAAKRAEIKAAQLAKMEADQAERDAEKTES